MNIADIKKLNEGVELRGFPLLIKTARKAYHDPNDDIWWQEVVFMDASGEIAGQIQIEQQSACWQSKVNLCIMDGTLQRTDAHGHDQYKLVVTECFDTATPLTWTQQQDLTAEEFSKAREQEVKGKIRCWLVAAVLQNGKKPVKNEINDLVEYVMKGE